MLGRNVQMKMEYIMEHVKEIQMLDLQGGHIKGSDYDSVLDHISQCPECKQRFDALKATWDKLGECEIDISGLDLVSALASPSGIHR